MSSKYLMQVKTVQSSAFRVLIEALKEILDGCHNFEFDETGLKIMAAGLFTYCFSTFEITC